MSIRAILLGSLACLCVNGAAQASSVTLEREVSSNPWGNEDWAESVTRSYNNQSSTLEAGMFRLQDANSMEKLFAFCIEPGVAIDLTRIPQVIR